MKKYFFYIPVMCLFLVSCIKEDVKIFTGTTVVEIDPTVLNPVSAGVTYPILTRIPPEGRPVGVACPDSTLRRYSGTIRIRINLVGPQSDKDETVGYKTFNTTITSISFPATLGFSCANPPPTSTCRQLPMVNSAPYTGTVSATCPLNQNSLAVTDAISGTHYGALSGKVTIPAKSSYGYIDIQILNPGTSSNQGRFLGIELDETGSVKPNPNYSKIGLVIDQR